MSNKWSFTEHPQSVQESYLEHMAMSWGFGWRLFVAAFAAVLHGVFPFLCVKTGSTIIRQLNEEMVQHRVKTGQPLNRAAKS